MSQPYIYTESVSLTPITRRGFAVQTQNNTSSHIRGNSCIHTSPYQKVNPPLGYETITSVTDNIFSSLNSPSSPFASVSSPSGLISSIAAQAPQIKTSEALPWPQVYAYRPQVAPGTRTTGVLGRSHRCIIGSYNARGLRPRTQARIVKGEIHRLESILNGLEGEEVEELVEEVGSHLARRQVLSKSRSFSMSISSPSSLVPKNQDICSTNSSWPTLNVILNDANKRVSAGNGAVTLPIVIDIVMDLDKVTKLPESPELFEQEVRRLEELENVTVKRLNDKIDQWSKMLREPEFLEDPMKDFEVTTLA